MKCQLFPRQLFDTLAMLRVITHKLATHSQLEICEVKDGRDGAANQGKRCSTFQARSEPTAGLHHRLKNFTRIVPEMQLGEASIRLDHVNNQRAPRIKVPQLVGSNAMECRKISPLQQEINRSRGGPASLPGGNGQFGLISDAVKSALRVRAQTQMINPVLPILGQGINPAAQRLLPVASKRGPRRAASLLQEHVCRSRSRIGVHPAARTSRPRSRRVSPFAEPCGATVYPPGCRPD